MKVSTLRTVFLASTALSIGLSTTAFAQIQEIIVTAQKREQRLQDVPVAVTAFTTEALTTNRIRSVMDLDNLAPGFKASPSIGGAQIPTMQLRGANSQGLSPGADKQVGIYLDGVYMGAPRGTIFELPAIAQLELLRGPQGTLFGRNATAGAVNVTTRNPSGKFSAEQNFSVGNLNGFRSRTLVETPEFHKFSFLGAFAYETRDGDVKNQGAGTAWDRTVEGKGITRASDTLGAIHRKSFFAAANWDPTSDLNFKLKVDANKDKGSPSAQVAAGPAPAGSFWSLVLPILVPPSPDLTNPGSRGHRPKVANNWGTVDRDQFIWGVNLTGTWNISDNVTLKNITGYRSTSAFTPTETSGFGGFVTAIPLGPIPAGTPVEAFQANNDYRGKQISDELQLNVESKFVTATAGALYYHSKDILFANTNILNFRPAYKYTAGEGAVNYNEATSLAAYTQLEFHLTDMVDLVGGVRITQDKKSGYFQDKSPLLTLPFDYKKTKPNYSVGVNFKPNDNLLAYAKYSTAFVSGGSSAGLAFDPENVKSYEAGIKSEAFDKKLRTNVTLWKAKYEHIQATSSGTILATVDPVNFGFLAPVSTVVISQGYSKAWGVEYEGTLAPGHGLTLGASAGYTHLRFGPVNPVLSASTGGQFLTRNVPTWTLDLTGRWESEPLFNDVRFVADLDAGWSSAYRLLNGPKTTPPSLDFLDERPASWVVNGRAALTNFELGDAGTAEVALWARNITNNDYAINTLFVDILGFTTQTYTTARTFGGEVNFRF